MRFRAIKKYLYENPPIRLVIMTTVCVFSAEALIMMFLSILPDLGTWATIFVDSTLIIMLVLPVLYFSLFKPLQLSLKVYATSEESLQQSESTFRSYVNSSPYAIMVVDKDGQIIDVNDATTKVSGYSHRELLSMHLGDLYLPEDKQIGIDYFSSVVSKGHMTGTLPVITKSGETKYLKMDCVQLDKNRFLGFANDITKRMQTEERAVRLAAFAQMNPAPLLRTDLDGRITLVNSVAGKLFDRDVIGELIGSVLTNSVNSYRNPSQGNTFLQFEQMFGDDTYLFSVRRHEATHSTYVYGSLITETKRLERLESRAARLETAGTIAGQVAHDFNNLLAPLIAYPEFIRDELPEDHPALTYLEDIENSAQKIADINQQLLTLSRRGHYNQDVLNLNTVILQSVKEMTLVPESVDIATDLDPDLLNILGGSAQIHRVVSNLLCNALDALQDIGHISIRTENYYADDVSGVYGRVPKGEYVKLTVSDTGCGISDEIAQKILDPFFTTKISDKKRGSGLGLSVVDAVVKDHKGYLDMETQSGKGTSFYLYFPTTHGVVAEEYSDATCGGTETILIVDDDEVQRDVSSQILKKLGYKVNDVGSGENAAALLRESPYDLLILDMVMPGGIDGAETYRQVHQFNPNQRTIIVSGFSDTERVQIAQALGAGAFVKKPLTKKAIAAAVRTELDKEKRLVQPNTA